MLTRRTLLSISLTTAGSLALGCGKKGAPGPATPPVPPEPEPEPVPAPEPQSQAKPQGKTLLILGGTGFLGPQIVEVAKARGYTITLFNRGKTRPELFADVEKLRGDRDPNKGDGLKALQGRQWDAVIDTSGYYPRLVKASAELLAPNVKQYIFISSVSAYATNDTANVDESAPVATIADPTVETMGENYENYGALKALCEQAAEAAMPGRVANVRPGYIVGPGDPTDRFTYWPLRVEKGGEVLAPGTPENPIQIIDVRDLGSWLVTLVDNKTMGMFNAVGPGEPLTMASMLETCKTATGSDARFTWVTNEFLTGLKGEPIDLPIWVPAEGESAGFHLRKSDKARSAGLTFRPVPDTIKDTLAWFKTLPAERQAKLRAGISPEREAEILAAWHEQAKKPQKKTKKGGQKGGQKPGKPGKK